MIRNPFGRAAALALVLPLALAAAACSDSPTDLDDHEELPVEMRLTVGGQVVTVDENSNVTPSPVFLSAGTHQVSVQFIDDEGEIMTLSNTEYRLEITSDNSTLLSYQGASAFTGTLTATGAGSTAIHPQLLHIQEGHPDFGPFPVPVTVQ